MLMSRPAYSIGKWLVRFATTLLLFATLLVVISITRGLLRDLHAELAVKPAVKPAGGQTLATEHAGRGDDNQQGTVCMSTNCLEESCCCAVQGVPDDAAQNKPDVGELNERQIISQLKAQGVEAGGWWTPRHCDVVHRVAIIIPFQKSKRHLLLIFLNYMHTYLQRQKLAHTIYVVDQVDALGFNRAMLFNVGFREAMVERDYTCLVFHDVDQLPVDQLLSYRCDKQPVHMLARSDKYDWGLPYKDYVGGVTKQQPEHMDEINGFANRFWGIPGEDDDLLVRWRSSELKFGRPGEETGNYVTVGATSDLLSAPTNEEHLAALRLSHNRLLLEGLNSLHYRVKNVTKHELYTHLQVVLEDD